MSAEDSGIKIIDAASANTNAKAGISIFHLIVFSLIIMFPLSFFFSLVYSFYFCDFDLHMME